MAGRQAGSVRFARSVAAAKHESAGGSDHTARAVVVVVVAVNFSAACSVIVDAGPGSGSGSDDAAGRCDGEERV